MVLEEHRIDGIFEVMRSKVELCNILMLTLTSGCSTQMVKHKTRALLTKSGRDHMNLNILSLEDILDGFFSGMSGPLSLPMV